MKKSKINFDLLFKRASDLTLINMQSLMHHHIDTKLDYEYYITDGIRINHLADLRDVFIENLADKVSDEKSYVKLIGNMLKVACLRTTRELDMKSKEDKEMVINVMDEVFRKTRKLKVEILEEADKENGFFDFSINRDNFFIDYYLSLTMMVHYMPIMETMDIASRDNYLTVNSVNYVKKNETE